MTDDDQMDLIEVETTQAKEIAGVARELKKAQRRRQTAQDKENGLKESLLEKIRGADIEHDGVGKYRFRADGLLITVTPKKESVSIKDEDEEE